MTPLLRDNTPVEPYQVGERTVWVKREDLACTHPYTPFAKIRGVEPYMRRLAEEGVRHFGYVDTAVSMGGCAVAVVAERLGVKAHIYFPRYKSGKILNIARHEAICAKLGADVRWIERPQVQNVHYAIARREFETEFTYTGCMLPLGLPFDETVHVVAREAAILPAHVLGGSIVCCAGSGTMLTGVLTPQLVPASDIFGVVISNKDPGKMRGKILSRAGALEIDERARRLRVVSAGYKYLDKEERPCPFPCNEFYDRKVWYWLLQHLDELRDPVLFWNIGGDETEPV